MADIDAEASSSVFVGGESSVNHGHAALATDEVTLDLVMRTVPGAYVPERLSLQDTVTPIARYMIQAFEGLRLTELIRRAEHVQLADGVAFSEVLQLIQSAVILERLQLQDTLIGNAIYGWTVNENLRLRDDVARFFGVSITDAITIEATMEAMRLRGAVVTEQVGILVEHQPQMVLRATVSDGVSLTAAQALNMLFQASVTETFDLEMLLAGPDGAITTWAMNTLTGAVSEYDNYAFCSFAEFGGRYYGASATGLYELLGDDDNGDDILARIKGGYLQFGGTQLSRLKEAYIAMGGEGEVILKIITGDGAEYVYGVETRDMRSTKVHMGKGQRARYFAYELTTRGQDFDLDTLEFVPIVVQRRV